MSDTPASEPIEDSATGGGAEPAEPQRPLLSAPRGAFSRRLALAFATVAAVTALFAAVLLSAAWNYEFDDYVRDNLQRISDGVAEVAAQAYPVYGGWSIETLSFIPRFGPTRGIGVQIVDTGGNLIYDDVMMHSGVDGGQGEGQQFQFAPEDRIVTSPIMVNGQQVGSVRVWAYGPGAVLTERDEQFRRGSFAALTVAALLAIALASVGGLWYANRLVRPIERITLTAQALRGGDREARTGMDGEDEVAILGRTFDEMADAIEADRELERRLTADVAHELRTPLQAIQATVEAMQDGVLPADEERLGTVRDETMRLARLADAILELTRLERGSLPFDMRRLDLSVPVRAAIDAHEALIECGELTLTSDISEGLFVQGDADRLQQAIANLLSNAVRYTPAGGTVSVRLSVRDGRAALEIADSGIGIAEEDLGRVFQRFWRADNARARATGGLGIGLAVTREIVDRHCGTITAERREEGGTRFTVLVPLA